MDTAASMELESWIAEHGLDEKCANALRAENERTLGLVMGLGPLKDVTNKSAVVMARIHKCKNQASLLPETQVTITPESLEAYLTEHQIDEKAADQLRAEAPAIQQAVLDAGPLDDAKNKSAAIMGRIGKAKKGRLFSGGGGLNTAIQKFIEDNELDEKCAEILKNEQQSVKRQVLEAGRMDSASNKSAIVMSRIKKAQKNVGPDGSERAMMKAMSSGMSKEQEMMMAMNMGAMNMMGNMMGGMMGGMGNPMMEMMMMQQMMMGGMGGMMPGMMGGKGGKAGKMGGTPDVQNFIKANGLDDKSALALCSLPQHQQLEVINRGSLESAKNPSAALMGRIRQLSGRSSPY